MSKFGASVNNPMYTLFDNVSAPSSGLITVATIDVPAGVYTVDYDIDSVSSGILAGSFGVGSPTAGAVTLCNGQPSNMSNRIISLISIPSGGGSITLEFNSTSVCVFSGAVVVTAATLI